MPFDFDLGKNFPNHSVFVDDECAPDNSHELFSV